MLMALEDKEQTGKNHNFKTSLEHAVAGLKLTWKEERNFKIHLITAFFVIVAGLFLRLTFLELSIILLCVVLVLVAEIVNTLTENLVDMYTKGKYDIRAKKIKDLAAGGVLLSALFAAVIGIVIFANKIW